MSTATETVLFVGGPRDGEWLSVALPLPYRFRVMSHPKRNLFELIHQDDPEPTTFATTEYVLTKLAGYKERFSVYVVEGMTGDVFMATLLEGYRSPK